MKKLFITIFLALWFIINMSSCTFNDYLDENFITLAGDTFYDPIVIAEEKVFCYGTHNFRVTISAELSDGTSLSFVLISSELGQSEEMGLHDYEVNTINSQCGDGVILPYGNIVQGGFSNIGETFSIIGSVGMECYNPDGSWQPINSDLFINLHNIQIL